MPSHLVRTPKIINFVIDQDDWSELGEMAVISAARDAPVRGCTFHRATKAKAKVFPGGVTSRDEHSAPCGSKR
jgi:hypothetical protein